MSDITKAIERAKELDRIATPGPWSAQADPDPRLETWGYRLTGPQTRDHDNSLDAMEPADASFIAESRTLLPQMVSEVERLQVEVEKISDACEIAKAPNFDRSSRIIEAIRNLWSAYHSNLRHGIQTTDERDDAIARAERAESLRTMSEWRPLFMLALGVKNWPTWALTGIPVPVLIAPVITDGIHEIIQQAACIQARLPFEKDASRRPRCRPVDSEGIPVPWAKVGL